MDGRILLPKNQAIHFSIVTLAAMTVFFLAASWSPPAFAQAMGKATLDPPTPPVQVAATVPATPAPAQAPAPAPVARTEPALVAPVPATPVAKAPAPLPSELKAPSIAETKPVPPVIPEPKPQISTKPVPEKIIDSIPLETPKPAALAIEQKPIRSSTDNAAATPANKVAAGENPPVEKSYLPPGVANALQVGAALAVVIGLVFIGKALARKFLPGAKAGNGKGVIEILARYPLSKNQSLVLIRIGSQIVTLNQGKDQSQSVLVISDAEEVAKIMGQIEGTSPKSIQAGFTRLLANARMDLQDPANDPENDFESRSMEPENLDTQLEEMASAKRQLMELRQQVRSVRDSLPR